MTIKEIARLAEVSPSTVSKIVNGKDKNINSNTRSRVLKIVKEYNYTPYATVKTLNKSKSFTLALLISRLPSPSLIRGIMNEAAFRRYNITIYDSKDSTECELKNITSICRANIDGVIWIPVNDESASFEHYISEKEIPICRIDLSDLKQGFAIDFCGLGYKMTNRLLQAKHTKIACLLRNDDAISAKFEEGYKKSLYEHHISYDLGHIIYEDDTSLVSKIVTQRISALVCSDYTLALDLYQKMYALHYRIPYNLSLISLKDDYNNGFVFPRISSISIPYDAFGQYICSYIIDKCEKKAVESYYSLFQIDPTEIEPNSIDIPYDLRSKKITVIGSINIDITYNVDFFPQIGKATQIINSSSTLGGKGANQAIAITRLNHEATLIGVIGNDIDSDFIFDFLRQENVSSEGIHRNLNIESGKAHFYINSNGENATYVLPGANGLLSNDDISSLKHLFENTGYCLLSTEIPEETITLAAHIAKEYGSINILKPAISKHLPIDLVKNIDIFVPNYEEAMALHPTASSTEELAEYFYNLGIPTVIITLGRNGCYLKTSEITRYYPAANFSTTDTTGGADAFIATLAAYLTSGYTLDASIQIATYAAGFCISGQGVIQSLVNRNTLESHIKREKPLLISNIAKT